MQKRLGSAIGSVVLYALLPKCPLCIAAALSALGLGASVSASIAPLARPLLCGVAALLLALSMRALSRARGPRAACCVGVHSRE